jgi:type IV pilus assembly protein PilB
VISLRTKALEQGMVPLRDNGWQKVIAGETTIEEVIAIAATYHTA